MGYETRMTCDGPACSNATPYSEHDSEHDHVPGDWRRVLPGKPSEPTKDFCSLDCLAAWAAQQVGKSLVQYKAWTPPSSQVDLRQPFGCWPLGTQNAGSARADAIGGSQASGTAIFGVISSSDEYNAGIAR